MLQREAKHLAPDTWVTGSYFLLVFFFWLHIVICIGKIPDKQHAEAGGWHLPFNP